MTEEQIEQLYEKTRNISAGYLIFRQRDNIEQVKKIMPQIQEFVLWFMKGNQFGIEQQLYEDMCKNILLVLQDILAAMQHNDKVLMQDAIAYGLMEYLKCFIGDTAEEE